MLLMQVLADVYWDHMDGGWFLMVIGMALFWGFVIVLLVWLLRGGLNRTSLHKPSPLDILDRRFAEGEITAEEYRERRSILERTRDS